MVVRVLPVGYTTVVIAGQPYYTYAGYYYIVHPDGYVVVDPPVE